MFTMAIPWLHIEVSGGIAAQRAGGLNGLNLRGGSAHSVEVALSDDFSSAGGDDAAEVRVRRGESRRLIGQLGGAFDEGYVDLVGRGVVGLEPMVGSAHYWEHACSRH